MSALVLVLVLAGVALAGWGVGFLVGYAEGTRRR